MRGTLWLAVLAAALGVAAGNAERAPVLIELFTSEGCSSCPPADRLLEQLDGMAIVLSEHVDYWNSQGWRDPYSSHANTLRQEAYARAFSIEGPYTPQMVVDGVAEFVGNDAKRVQEELGRARSREKAGVRIVRSGRGVEVTIDAVGHNADVMLALAKESGTSQVGAGENSGRTLHHIAMVESLRKIGNVKKGAGFHQTVEVPAETGRVIVFVQDSGLGKVYGVGMLAR